MTRLKPTVLAFCLAICAFGLFPALSMASMEKPAGKTILTISGAISEHNSGDEAHFDRDMLKSLGLHKLTTSNPFETGVQNFEGVLLSDLLKKVGAKGTKIVAYALDGYAVEIPMEDAMDYPVLLALVWNGKTMTVRNKGPIWVVYPIDQYDTLKDEKYSGRSIWQLGRLVIH